MMRSKYRKMLAFIISMLLVFSTVPDAFAEETAAENGAAPEEVYVYDPFADEAVMHRLWGFFTARAENDTDWLMRICATEWKKGKEDPRQALEEFIKSEKLHGYRVESLSGEAGDATRTLSILLKRETENGEYTYSLHEIVCRKEADGYFFDPDGFASGSPADPVPEEELTLLTPEGIIRSSLDMHESEGLYDRLIPVNVCIEKQGIRVEIISGLIEGKNIWQMISLQDTEGKYDGLELDPSFADAVEQSSSRRWWSRLYHDGAERKDTFIVCQELDAEILPEVRYTAAGVGTIRVKETQSVDLLPMLTQYGGTAEGVIPPKLEEYSYRKDQSGLPEGFRVLDYNQPLDVPLFREVYLTGIGWIGDKLHVQYHNKGNDFAEMTNGRASACSIWTEASVAGKTYSETVLEYSPQEWDGDGNGWPDWEEYIINCKPEEAEQLEISAEISITTKILEGDWQVLIGLDRLREAPGT